MKHHVVVDSSIILLCIIAVRIVPFPLLLVVTPLVVCVLQRDAYRD
jgi:hypothetical protein